LSTSDSTINTINARLFLGKILRKIGKKLKELLKRKIGGKSKIGSSLFLS